MSIIIRSIHALLWILAAYKWGDWKNWNKYYPTMLFMGMGDLIYVATFHDKKLWYFNSIGINPIFSELFVIFTIFSCTVLLFLSNLPDTFIKKVKYIVMWIIIYIVIEIFMLNIGMQYNANGWSIWWSLIHNCYQFPLIALHYKRPYAAWVLAVIIFSLAMLKFGLYIVEV